MQCFLNAWIFYFTLLKGLFETIWIYIFKLYITLICTHQGIYIWNTLVKIVLKRHMSGSNFLYHFLTESHCSTYFSTKYHFPFHQKKGSRNYSLWAKCGPLPVFLSSFIGTHLCLFVHASCMAASVLWWQSWVAASEPVWRTKPKVLPVSDPSRKKFADLRSGA